MPPEFSKKYVPLVSESKLEDYQRKSPFGDAKLRENEKMAPQVSPTKEAPRAIRSIASFYYYSVGQFRAMYQELLPHNLDPRYRDRIRERLERREMMLRRHHLTIPEFYVGRYPSDVEFLLHED